MHLAKSSLVAIVLLAGFHQAAAAAGADSAPRVEVTGARFEIDLDDGRILQGADLVGVILHLRDRGRKPLEIRIDSVTALTGQPAADVELYGLSRRDAQGGWSPLCKPGADGRALGFPLPATIAPYGDVEAEGGSFSIACTAGARGKCVMLGYKPWAAANGESLQPYFEACVRMMRADYCGDGRSYTRPGIRVDMWDSAGVQTAQTDMPFEAAWRPDGAVCLSRTRAAAIGSLAGVLAACPRLAKHSPAQCESWSGSSGSGALLWNRSPLP